MFVSAYLGRTPESWRDALRAHAAWLGLHATGTSLLLPSGALLEIGWIRAASAERAPVMRESEEWVVSSAFGDVPPALLGARSRTDFENAAAVRPDNGVTIALHRASGDLVAVVPPASPQQLLYAPAAGGWVVADDVRLFRRLTPTDLDERGLYALAQFGAIPAPLTLFRNVRRVPNGHALRLPAAGGEPTTNLVYRPATPRALRDGLVAADYVERGLQTLLGEVPGPAALYFSGGVDSALLAAQWRELGRDDLSLTNYAFGAADAEGALAARMAEHLGFALHRVEHGSGAVGQVLERIGRDYSFPFGDISAVPTNVMVHEAAAWTPPGAVVLEGTGADGAYGFGANYPWWRGVYRAPRLLRRLVGAAYGATQLWRYNSRAMQVLRFVRKSAGMSLPEAVVAQSALDGIALRAAPELRHDVAGAVRASIETLASGAAPPEQASWVDLVWVCAGRMAPKSFDPLRRTGLVPRYPYIEPPMLAVSAALSWDEKCAGGVAKAPLKALLARRAPPEWVYRPKHGFTPPGRAILSAPAAQEGLRRFVTDPGNPFQDVCNMTVIHRMTTLVRQAPLSSGVHDLLWVLLFTASWLDQVPATAPRPSGASLVPPTAPQTVGR